MQDGPWGLWILSFLSFVFAAMLLIAAVFTDTVYLFQCSLRLFCTLFLSYLFAVCISCRIPTWYWACLSWLPLIFRRTDHQLWRSGLMFDELLRSGYSSVIAWSSYRYWVGNWRIEVMCWNFRLSQPCTIVCWLSMDNQYIVVACICEKDALFLRAELGTS